jgi:F-type H+-transporting ATPase subunit b
MYLEASIITLNGTWLIEVVAFIVMVAVLWKYAYPPIQAAAERRQKAIADALEAAEKQRQEAEQRLKDAEAKLDDARKQAQEVIAGAGKSAEQIRSELKQKGEDERQRELERARQEIAAEREKAVQGVRAEVTEMVITATQKVIGEALDARAHRKLIEDAIEEVRTGRDGGGNGRRR